MKRKILLMLCFLCCFGWMRAEVCRCLQVVSSDGVTNIPLAAIRQIVHPDEASVQIALHAVNELTFSIEKVEKMIFTEADVTGIEAFWLSPEILEGAGIYDLSGHYVGNIVVIHDRVDVSRLPKGVSIIKAGDKVLKIIR
ncbi:MAG: hypothetical protein J1E02_08660 [Coprobacter sp.]|nr:hypothetical protein [Coprobacter sp.]